MSRKTGSPSFPQALDALRSAQFDVNEVPGAPGQVRVSKHGCAAVLAAATNAPVALVARPGFLLGGEISRVLDRGFQKFLKAGELEVPATAGHLQAVHRFSEELKEITGGISLYNESLGTVSDRYVYDRMKGRELPETQRPPRAWDLPVDAGK